MIKDLMTGGYTLFNSYKLEKLYSKKSFSQCGEDLIVDFILKADSINNGNYVDIGAHHPFWLNNTYFFYKIGWRGLNIDAQKNCYELFNKYRKHDKNILAVVGASEEQRKLFIFDADSLSTASLERADLYLKMGHQRS